MAILHFELIDIEPLIWRRVAVATATNLQTPHRIIQAAMGWLDYHLWEFTLGDKTYGVPDPDDIGWGIRFTAPRSPASSTAAPQDCDRAPPREGYEAPMSQEMKGPRDDPDRTCWMPSETEEPYEGRVFAIMSLGCDAIVVATPTVG